MSQFRPPFDQPEPSETASLQPAQPETESLRWEQVHYPPRLPRQLSMQPSVPPQIIDVQKQPESPPVETMTKVYTKVRKFRKDRERLAKGGWTVTKTTAYRVGQGAGRMVVFCLVWNALFAPKFWIIVTYGRLISQSESHSGRI